MALLERVFASPSVFAAMMISATALGVAPSAIALSHGAFRTEGMSGGIGIRVIDNPATDSRDSAGTAHIAETVKPGTTVSRRLEVSNATTVPHSVAIYAAAATVNNGSFIGAPGRAPNELSSWTAVEKPALGLPQESAESFDVTIAIPDDAPLGEMYAIVWAEVGTPDADKSSMAKRVGIRLYVEVSHTDSTPLGFAVDTVTAHRKPDGKSMLLAHVRNTGGRALDFSGTMTLASITGSPRAGPIAAEFGTTLAPGQSGPVRFRVEPGHADGPWNVKIELSSGRMRESYQAEIRFPSEPGASAASPASHITPLTGWVAAALIGIVIAAALLLMAMLVRGRNSEGTPR